MKHLAAVAALWVAAAVGSDSTAPLITAADCWKAEAAALMGDCLHNALPNAEVELERQVAAAHQRFKQRAQEEQSTVYRSWLNTAASQLLRAQPAWRRYRDAHCASRDGLITGNDHGMAAVRCKLEMTTARIQEVKSYSGGK